MLLSAKNNAIHPFPEIDVGLYFGLSGKPDILLDPDRKDTRLARRSMLSSFSRRNDGESTPVSRPGGECKQLGCGLSTPPLYHGEPGPGLCATCG